MYDTLAQYAQATGGHYDDWHPPSMARLWSLLAPERTGTLPLFTLQTGGWWLGLALIAIGLARGGRWHAAWGALAIGALPPLLGWQVAVLKDAQLVGAMLVAAGLVVGPRLAGQRVAAWRWAVFTILLGYAALVRANAIFAVAPLVAMLLPIGWWRRAAVAAALIVATLALSPAINHQLLGAEPTGVARTQAIYDLAGIAVRAPGADVGLPETTVAHIAARGCVRPFFWDPLGDERHCAGDVAAWQAMPVGSLYRRLALAAAGHPAAYLAQRLAHLNSTWRWLVPAGWSGAAPPDRDEPGALLRQPGEAAALWQRIAGWTAETPLGWPFVYVVLAAALLLSLGVDRAPAAEAARALLVSALALEASFAVISIASDVRYHLWPMVAILLATVVALPRIGRRSQVATAIALAAALLPALWARSTLPRPPENYQGMLG